MAHVAEQLWGFNKQVFQFNAKQRQVALHYQQNMANQRWSLFRQDIRDLFELTIKKLDAYFVVAALFCGYSTILYITPARPSGKEHTPEWIITFYINCVVSCLMFAVLSLWMSMYGSLTAHSMMTRLLTQSVRIPVATAEQVQAARVHMEEFERLNPKGWGRLPFMNQAMGAFRGSRGGENTAASVGGSVPPAPAGGGSVSWASDQGGSAVIGSEEAVPSGLDRGGKSIHDLKMQKHFAVFRKLQRNWQSYDAYTRISLSVAVSWYLNSVTYMVLGTLAAGQGHELSGAVGAVVCTCTQLFLFKLDLFVGHTAMRIVKGVLAMSPLLVVTAVMMGCANLHRPGSVRPETLWAFVALSSGCHTAWVVVVWFQARPSLGGRGLPMAFRAVQYLDVFDDAETAEQQAELEDPHVLNREAADLEDQLERIASALESQEMPEQVEQIATWKDTLHSQAMKLPRLPEISPLMRFASQISGDNFLNVSSVHSEDQEFVKVVQTDPVSGACVELFIGVANGVVQWEQPDTAVIGFEHLYDRVGKLMRRLTQYLEDEILGRESDCDTASVVSAAEPDEIGQFEEREADGRARPQSSKSVSELPYRYFRSACGTVGAVWTACFAIAVYDIPYAKSTYWSFNKTASFAQSPTPLTLPHPRFRLKGFSCPSPAGIVVYDDFNLWSSDVPGNSGLTMLTMRRWPHRLSRFSCASVRCAPDGTCEAWVMHQGGVGVYRTDTISALALPPVITDPVQALAVDTNDLLLATAREVIRVQVAGNGSSLNLRMPRIMASVGLGESILALSVLPDGGAAALVTSDGVYWVVLWDKWGRRVGGAALPGKEYRSGLCLRGTQLEMVTGDPPRLVRATVEFAPLADDVVEVTS
mmetsp:Transcript_55168/g.126745  ORF Transcript_55168/g.126745 Transcript_55168/m.126745 type:complete len:871 (-) Transcript_55168:11-2623(-)